MKARISIALLTTLSVLAGLGIAYSQQKELTPATNVSSRPAAQVTDPAKVTWTTVTVSDSMFNLPAFIVRIPADWTFEGAVLHGACGDDVGMLVYRASSPDGLTGVQVMPRVNWFYSQDPRALKFANVGACNLHPPVTALKQAPEIAAAARPNPQIGPVEPLHSPGFAEGIEKVNQALANQARAFGRPNDAAHQTGDEARVRIQYNLQGHPEEEWISVQTTVMDRSIPVSSTGANGILQSRFVRMQQTQTFVSAMRAPQGSLDASRPLLMGILTKVAPDYENTVMAFKNRQFAQISAANNAAFASTLKQGQDAGKALMAQHASYMAWQQQSREASNQKFVQDMNQKDAQNKNFVDYVGNQQYYLNPETGATVTVKNVPGADGVVARSVSGGWVQLAPISH